MGGSTQIASWDTVSPTQKTLPNLTAPAPGVLIPPAPGMPAATPVTPAADVNNPNLDAQNQSAEKPKEKKGFFDKVKGIFK
jgi:hypothetical protein